MPEFRRSRSHFTDRITAGGRDGWPAAAGRYRLVVSRACPWASRAVISRRLMGLEQAISLAVVDPIQENSDDTGHTNQWVFTERTGSPGGVDPVLGIHRIQQAYRARQAEYPGGESVPIVVDTPSGVLVTNDYAQITLDLATEWGEFQRPGAPDLYPAARRDEIDELNEDIYSDVNNGVYAAGFTRDQQRYDSVVHALFDRLDVLEQRLTGQRFLLGESITEPDIRLFCTLVRFDAVYHGHFKCNIRKLIEYPALWAYARDLFQTPGFGDTVNFDHIRRHYYVVQDYVNPSRVVAVGPDTGQWRTAHHREQLAGRPFGDGTPPAPPLPQDRVVEPVTPEAASH